MRMDHYGSSKRRRTPPPPMTNSTPFILFCVQTLLILFNTFGVIYRAYSISQYSFLSFVFFVYFSYFLANYLSSIYQSQKNSLEKKLLGLGIWFLISSIIFGFVYQFYPLFGFLAGLPIYAIAIASSGVLFYDYVICDSQDKDDGKWRCFVGDDMKRSYYEEKWEVIWEKV